MMVELPSLLPLDANPQLRPPKWAACRRLIKRVEEQVEQQRYTEAVTNLKRAITLGADQYASLVHIADIHRAQGQWQEAYAAVEEAIALEPQRLVAHEMALTIACDASDTPRIFKTSRTLIKLSPRHIAAHSALGMAFMNLNNMEAALRVTNTLIRLDPDNAAHHYKKALLCQHQGEVALAVHEFTITVRLDPHGSHATPAREALENLDAFQLNQVLTLSMEDVVFRTKLFRDPLEAVEERGYSLSDTGSQILLELCSHLIPLPGDTTRVARYN